LSQDRVSLIVCKGLSMFHQRGRAWIGLGEERHVRQRQQPGKGQQAQRESDEQGRPEEQSCDGPLFLGLGHKKRVLLERHSATV
jgi:hypothetical protein